MKTILPLTLCLCLCLGAGCSNPKYREAGAVAAMAGILTFVQAARSKAHARPSCSTFCDGCTFPCGNQCVPYGTLCYDPPGAACKGSNQVCEKWNNGKGDMNQDYSREYQLFIPTS